MNNLEEGFIGLNIERAASDITGFDNAAKYATESIMHSFSQLYNVLNNNWASPIAVEFTTSNSEIIIENAGAMARRIDAIYQGAVEAAISLASANGSSFPLSPSMRGTGIPYELIPCKDNLDGRVGMDVEAVKAGLEEFESNIKAALNNLSGVPDGIAFYDPTGNLIGGYHKNIMDFKEKFGDLANSVFAKMSQYIQEEESKITAAKQQAADTLSM